MSALTVRGIVPVLAAVFVALGANMALADTASAVPERRVAVIQNMDFFGGDLRTIRDTSLEACRNACLGDPDCAAFTFNRRNNACFPKSTAGDLTPFEGALSGRVIATDPQVLAGAAARQAELGFLPSRDLAGARRMAETMGTRFPADNWSEAELVAAAQRTRTANPAAALAFTGAAISLGDGTGLWRLHAEIALHAGDRRSAEGRGRLDEALGAAINAHLRALDPEEQAAALQLVADALEAQGRGRLSVRALERARDILPRPDIVAAHDRVVGLYGFRILDHEVESDSARPRICLQFSERLAEDGVDYDDFLRLSGLSATSEVDGWRLCVEGPQHGSHNQLTIRAGLPSAEGDRLARSAAIDFYVRDRAPQAFFPGRGYVLPARADAAIPITTVNMTEVDLTLYRIDDRNLLRGIQERMVGGRLWSFEERRLAGEIGAVVWQGSGNVEMELNREVTTRLPLADIGLALEPGVYGLSARVPGADVFDGPAATQWFVVSDTGLFTLSGADGLHVFARRLGDAGPAEGVRLQLVAVNNTVLAEAITDAEGHARFAPGLLRGTAGQAPGLLTGTTAATGGTIDYTYLDLREAEFDLSDRGVAGRPVAPGIDVFAVTDRGAYRPGETLHATILARDGAGDALSGLPLTAIVTRPDGAEHRRLQLPDAGAGGRVARLALPPEAQRGLWRMTVHADPEAPALASLSFLVEDFLPERIDFALALPEGPLEAGALPPLDIEARYLWGAAGADLVIEGEVAVSAAPGLEALPGYRFGRHDRRFDRRMAALSVARTDPAGKAQVALTLPETARADRPLRLTAVVRLREGSGRPVERRIERTLAATGPLIGIRPLFADDALPEGATAGFHLRALDADGAPADMAVNWTLNRVETHYQWFEAWGSWNWEPVTRRTRIATGEALLSAEAAHLLEHPVDWGRYELRVERADGEHLASSVAFQAGWFAPADTTRTPDMLDIGLDRSSYAPGDTALLRAVPRHAGQGLVTVMSDRLIARQVVELAEGENVIPLPVTEDWAPGVYVAVTALRPLADGAAQAPVRALGLAHAAVDPGDRALTVDFAAPAEAEPRGPLEARLSVEGLRPGETAYATIAAIDLGILNLTGHAAPDASAHYFGQRRLGMAIRDIYGRLIDDSVGLPGRLRSGGDAMGQARLQAPPPTEELVAFFQGPVRVGEDGTLPVRFDIPAFNGTVRLMAVVWSESGVGEASADVLLRDPVVVTASLPRFLAPTDRTRLLLEIAHAAGPGGEVSLEVGSTDGLRLDASGLPGTVSLHEGGRARIELPLIARRTTGNESVTIALETADGRRLEQSVAVQLRANDPELARTTQVVLDDGAAFVLDDSALSGLMPGSGRVALSAGPIARFDVPGLLAALDVYPFGCTEQVTSQALPLLHLAETAQAMGLATAAELDARIAAAIASVLMNQSAAGGFGLWQAASGDFWLDAYVTDFLSRARARGHAVPDVAFRSAIDNLRARVNYAPDFENGGEDIAYALHVLAREGAAAIGDLRYYADARAAAFATPLALAQLGAALAFYGDQARADALFARAAAGLRESWSRPEPPVWRADYGTRTRDTAAVLALAAEARTEAVDREELAGRLQPALRAGREASPQELAWSLLAAGGMLDAGDWSFAIDGEPLDGAAVRLLDAAEILGRTLSLRNLSGRPADLTLTIFGQPSEPEPAAGDGFRIERRHFTLEGAVADLSAVPAGTRLVTVLTVTPERRQEARLMVSDPLPAGFEIDNPAFLRAGDIRALDWLEIDIEPVHAEYRDDHFLAAVDLRSPRPFRVAYVVRAISPGSFHHPAASVEDMYRPAHRARSAAGQVTIVE